MSWSHQNPGLTNAVIYGLRDRGAEGDVDFQRLDLSTNLYLEKNLESLRSWINALANEQWKFQIYKESAKIKFKFCDEPEMSPRWRHESILLFRAFK
jgi:hypothetical protein